MSSHESSTINIIQYCCTDTPLYGIKTDYDDMFLQLKPLLYQYQMITHKLHIDLDLIMRSPDGRWYIDGHQYHLTDEIWDYKDSIILHNVIVDLVGYSVINYKPLRIDLSNHMYNILLPRLINTQESDDGSVTLSFTTVNGKVKYRISRKTLYCEMLTQQIKNCT